MPTTLMLKQVLDPTLIETLTLDVPTGSHDHEVKGGGGQTTVGGMHRHVFRTPGGDTLTTDISGGHVHTLYPAPKEDADELYTDSCGEHVHTITLADGTVLKTEIDGWHSHSLKADQSETADAGADPQGQHRHRLVLPNGVVLMSAMPGDDLAELAREAGNASYRVNMTKGYPQSPTAVGKAEIIVKNSVPGIRLTLGFDDSKYVVDLDVARKGLAVDSVDEASNGFGLTGYRYMTPILGSLCKAAVAKRASRVDSAVSVDDISVTWGLQSDTVKEAFLSGSRFTGTLVLRKSSQGWTASFDRVTTPQVLCKGAPLPPRGYSALPVSLAKSTPPTLSFWTTAAEELAKSQRDALAVSGYFAAECLAHVNGELRKIERTVTMRLYQPGLEKAEVRTYADEVRKLLPAEAKAVVAKGAAWELAAVPQDAVLLVEASSAGEVESLIKSEDRYLVIAEDTPETRRAMATLGQVFKLDHPDADNKVLVASYDLTLAKDARAAYSLPLGPGESKVLAANVDKALAQATHLQCVLRKADVEEEQFALGIVLEPDIVDAQNDTYDAPTIRKAAHLYMERYQNCGLQHKEMVNDRVVLVESYLAPVDMNINGTVVKAGTWLMGCRYDTELWKGIKDGKYTGFSIGGYADRTKVETAKAELAKCLPIPVPTLKPVDEPAAQTTEQEPSHSDTPPVETPV